MPAARLVPPAGRANPKASRRAAAVRVKTERIVCCKRAGHFGASVP